ncbi:hypothetical protein [Burkholderia anthina]|uniref:hypothetical protein n=1 Tax=Burkholderia anthina TaxID=179879 RepID=UPI0037C0CC0C
MASVIIDMGFGKRATLSCGRGSRQSLEQRAAVSELMLHWPRYSGLMTGAIGYLRELGLAGTSTGDPVATLRSAIEDGRVSVSVDRPVARGGAAERVPSTRPFPKGGRLASLPGVAALPVHKPLPSWATPSDVTADELIRYLEIVVAGTRRSLADTASGLVEGMPLDDAASFEYVPDTVSCSAEELAASTRNPGYAAKMLGYDRDIFGDMIHTMKDANDLGGADNVIWHDNGDVYFNGKWIDNMHNY